MEQCENCQCYWANGFCPTIHGRDRMEPNEWCPGWEEIEEEIETSSSSSSTTSDFDQDNYPELSWSEQNCATCPNYSAMEQSCPWYNTGGRPIIKHYWCPHWGRKWLPSYNTIHDEFVAKVSSGPFPGHLSIWETIKGMFA